MGVALSRDSRYLVTLGVRVPQVVSVWDWTNERDTPLHSITLSVDYGIQVSLIHILLYHLILVFSFPYYLIPILPHSHTISFPYHLTFIPTIPFPYQPHSYTIPFSFPYHLIPIPILPHFHTTNSIDLHNIQSRGPINVSN